MRTIKVLIALVFIVSGFQAFSQEQKFGLTWYTDINKVNELSQKTKKPIFAFFTGSDWCGWCHKLEKDVFAKPGFQAWAKKNVIMFEVDFPHNKQLPEKLAKQNNDLQGFFQVQGYPTIWLFNMNKDKATGKFSIAGLGSCGYPRCEPGQEEKTFLENLDTIMKNK
jgi:protein disulfide-isomerase